MIGNKKKTGLTLDRIYLSFINISLTSEEATFFLTGLTILQIPKSDNSTRTRQFPHLNSVRTGKEKAKGEKMKEKKKK